MEPVLRAHAKLGETRPHAKDNGALYDITRDMRRDHHAPTPIFALSTARDTQYSSFLIPLNVGARCYLYEA